MKSLFMLMFLPNILIKAHSSIPLVSYTIANEKMCCLKKNVYFVRRLAYWNTGFNTIGMCDSSCEDTTGISGLWRNKHIEPRATPWSIVSPELQQQHLSATPGRGLCLLLHLAPSFSIVAHCTFTSTTSLRQPDQRQVVQEYVPFFPLLQ